MVNEPKQPHQVLTATPCNQSSGADPRLDYALYESLIQDHNSPLEQRLHHCLSVFLGRAYEFDPLGDGLSCRIDRRSRLQTASFDCMTFAQRFSPWFVVSIMIILFKIWTLLAMARKALAIYIDITLLRRNGTPVTATLDFFMIL